MQQIFTKKLPIALTLLILIGVLLHDTQMDKATTFALALPAMLASYAVVDSAAHASDHVHIQRVSIGAQQPRVQPRNDDDKEYMTQKRTSTSSTGNDYSWPSV